MVCGESRTVISLVLQMRSTWSAKLGVSLRYYLEAHSQKTIPLPTSVRINCTSDVFQVCELDECFWLLMQHIFVIHCTTSLIIFPFSRADIDSGGLGLTGGIADISTLFDSFLGIHNGLTDDSILERWSEIRIQKWRDIIDPMSRANFRRLWDEEVSEEREAFFEICRGITQGGEGRLAYRAVSMCA
jgi:hypothetical protein